MGVRISDENTAAGSIVPRLKAISIDFPAFAPLPVVLEQANAFRARDMNSPDGSRGSASKMRRLSVGLDIVAISGRPSLARRFINTVD